MIFTPYRASSVSVSSDPTDGRVWSGVQWLGRWVCCLWVAIGLGGCMDYDVGIQFKTQHSGAIVQQIHLDRMTTLGSVTLEQWFESLERRTQLLQGYSRYSSPQDLELTLPFANGADLVQKFNQWFASETNTEASLFPLSAHLDLKQQNALLAIRNQLDLTVDLRELGGVTPQGEQLFDLDPLLHLSFSLQTPWGSQWSGSQPTGLDSFPLQSGQLNHLTATFWVPSPLGIGSAILVSIVWVATVLRKRLGGCP